MLRLCGFCIVSGKEGRKSRKAADLSEFWDGQKEIKLLDANLLACPDHEALILQLAESRAWVDFSQGLDIRLVTPDNVALLNRVRTKAVHFAWDNPGEDLTGHFKRFLELTAIKSDRKDGKRSHPRSRRKENPLRHKQLKYVCSIVRSSRLSA